MKKIIIFKHGGGELANQLWNYLSIYAWSLEEKVPLSNPSFYEYHGLFNFLKKESLPVRLLAKMFTNYRGRKQNLWKKAWRMIYSLYTRFIELTKSQCILSSQNQSNEVTYVPPTVSLSDFHAGKNKLFPNANIYISGWLFRNPIGLEKYREELVEAFTPHPRLVEKMKIIMSEIGQKYSKVIGLHIRQGDYKTWKGGKYFIEQTRIRTIINEYLTKNSLDAKEILFLIMSDGTIEKATFDGLNIKISKEHPVADLFLLSKTDAIIGSDSSFGHLASWFGNIPHIVLKNEEMDWGYYQNRRSYFPNKYCLMVHF